MAGRQPARPRAGLLGDLSQWVDQAVGETEKRRRAGEAVLHEWSQRREEMGRKPGAPGQQAIAARQRFQKPAAPAPVRRLPGPSLKATPPRRNQLIDEVADQGFAGARGAQDAFTFGLGDRAYAGARSLLDASHGEDLGEAYARRMALERARDAYDAQHYATARTIGQVVGTGAQIAATGAIGGAALAGVRAAQGGVRIAQATPLIAREIAALGAAGGSLGMGSQAVSDVSRGRLSSIGDYVGAGAGGVAGALTARTGRAGYVGATDGAVTSVAQDLLNGRTPSVDRAREAATVGAAFGAAGGLAGRVYSNGMTNAAKERLGEQVSLWRTWAKGDKTISTSKTREYLPNQKYTYPDQRTSRELVESKMGVWAKLSQRQTEASQMLSNYRVDHTLPRDVGAALAIPFASLGLLSYHNPIRRH